MADSLTENFKELRLKTAEEIEKSVVDESLSPIERAIFLLCSGEDVQKLSVLTELGQLLRTNSDEVQRRVLPKIREMIAVCSLELHQAASKASIDILQKNILPPESYAKHFVPMIMTGIDFRDVDVSVLWLDTLLEVVDLLPTDVVVAQILPKAQHFSHPNQPSSAKLLACRLLGKIAIRLPTSAQRKTDIMPFIKSLAQELEFDVRAAVCYQLSLIAKGLSQQEVRDIILPELLELCNDDDFHVRTAALEALVILAPQLENETIRTSALPFILKFFRESITGNSSALPSISAVIGKVCLAFSQQLNADERQFCIDCFRRLCGVGNNNDQLISNSKQQSSISSNQQSGKGLGGLHSLSFPNSLAAFGGKPIFDVEARPILCREHAATNFPLMFQFCGLSRFKQDLRPTISSLCLDSSSLVRRSIAGCFHELVTLLDADAHILTKDLSALLDDNSLDVIDKITANFDTIAAVLGRNNFRIPATIDSRPSNSGIVLTSLINCDQTLSRTLRWRLHVDLISKFASLRLFCSSEVIYVKILPVLFNRLSSARQLPLKLACIRTILALTRSVDQYERWLETFQKLTEDLLRSPNSYRRALYIDLCHMVLELYSRAFFKSNCLESVLTIAQDPVPNMRIRLCELLLKVKSIIRLPADRSLLQALESAVRKLLLNETDRAVSSVVLKTVEKLDKIEVKMLPMGRSSLPIAAESEADLEDIRREEEERSKQDDKDDRDKKEEQEANSKKTEKGEKPPVSKQSNRTTGARDSPAGTPLATLGGSGSFSSTTGTTGASRRVRTSKRTTGKDSSTAGTSSLPLMASNATSVSSTEILIGSFPINLSNTAGSSSSTAASKLSLSTGAHSTTTTSTLASTIGQPRRNSVSKTRPGVAVEIDEEEDYISFLDYRVSFRDPTENNSDAPGTITPRRTPREIASAHKRVQSKIGARRQSLPTVAFGSTNYKNINALTQQTFKRNTLLPALTAHQSDVNVRSDFSPLASGAGTPRSLTPKLTKKLQNLDESGPTTPAGAKTSTSQSTNEKR